MLFVASAHKLDWLVDTFDTPAALLPMGEGNNQPASLALDNGLLRRQFVLSPAFGTIDLANAVTNESALRHIQPEAMVCMGTQISLHFEASISKIS